MEKTSRFPAFLLFLGIASVLLGSLAIALSCAAMGAARAVVPTADDALAVSGIPDFSIDLNSSDQKDAEIERSPANSDTTTSNAPLQNTLASPTYTVRLLPEQTQDSPCCVGIYDSAQDLILQAPIPLVTLSLSDQAALRDGIIAPDFESAKLLLNDFCS